MTRGFQSINNPPILTYCYYEVGERGLKYNEFGGGGEMYSGHPSNLFLKWNSPYLQTIEAKANPESRAVIV